MDKRNIPAILFGMVGILSGVVAIIFGQRALTQLYAEEMLWGMRVFTLVALIALLGFRISKKG